MTMTTKLNKLHSLLLMAMMIIASLAMCACEDDDDGDVDADNRPAEMVGNWTCGTHRIELYADGHYMEYSGTKLVKNLDKWYVYSGKLFAIPDGTSTDYSISYIYDYYPETDILVISNDKYHRATN